MTHPRSHHHSRAETDTDRGSVTPLVIGMMFCLLLLGCGVTAAGSAFLGHQHLRNLCDGAATVATDAGAVTGNSNAGAHQAAAEYLAIRAPDITATATITPGGVRLTCNTNITVTFGALFGHPTIHATTTSTGRSTFTTET